MWLQQHFSDSLIIDGRKTALFWLWLAWSRSQVVLALQDRTASSVFAALELRLRRRGGNLVAPVTAAPRTRPLGLATIVVATTPMVTRDGG